MERTQKRYNGYVRKRFFFSLIKTFLIIFQVSVDLSIDFCNFLQFLTIK